MAKKSKKKRVGRPPKPPGEKYEIVSVSLPPAHISWLDSQDGGRSSAIQSLIQSELKRARRRKVGR